jgi:hypothetical protein
MFHALFAAASETLLELGASRLSSDLGFSMVIHTWTRDLRFHPHLYAIVAAGGLSLDGSRWNSREEFLLPVRVLGALLRGKMLAKIRQLHADGVFAGFDHFRDPEGFDRMMAKLAKKRCTFSRTSGATPIASESPIGDCWNGKAISSPL